VIELWDSLAQQLQPVVLGVEHYHAAVRGLQAGANILHSVDSRVHVKYFETQLGGGQRSNLLRGVDLSRGDIM
jgi:hypothetical protein